MIVILKQILPWSSPGIEFKMEMPVGSKILDVQPQTIGGKTSAVIWYTRPRIFNEDINEMRTFCWVFTGEEVGITSNHIKTLIEHDLVWHLFEINPRIKSE